MKQKRDIVSRIAKKEVNLHLINRMEGYSMFQWKENFQWIFSNLGSSDKVGVNESGIGIFKRQPYKGLAKEILQNVTDAKNPELPDEVPVRAKFELIYVDLEDIPGHERLREVISSLLASVIYYACIEVKNSDCAEAIKSITGEYVKEFEDGEPIYFEGSDAKPKPKLTYTLQDPSFDKVFVKVKSWLINLLSGVTEIEIYKVSDVTNRQLRFNRMREYLIDHIGEYVFSRANVSEIIFIQIVELVGRTNKQLFLKNSLKINRMLYYMKIKTKSSRYKMWQQKEYYQLY